MFPLLLLLLLRLMSCCINTAASHGFENGFNDETRHCVDKERQALLGFKAGVIDDSGFLSSWSSEEDNKDCCNWWGVMCSDQTGHVTRLDLSVPVELLRQSVRLRGNISSSLLELRELNSLVLSGCDFGRRPIPKFFGSFSKLEYLYLSDSNLAGFIPSQLGNLSNLINLDLSSNLLHGMIPKSFGNLCNLQYLDLKNNRLSGNISSSLLELRELKFLDLSTHDFGRRPIPEFFGSFSKLESLLLSDSKLAGFIPSQLGNLSNLIFLDLSSNLLHGMIPESFGYLCNLQELYLQNNMLSGNLSLFVDNLSGCPAVPALKWLVLSGNQLSGTLTKNLGTLTMLSHLDLSSNSLNGVVFEAHLSNLLYLGHLDMSLNHLDFQISPQWVPDFQLDYISLKSCNLGPSFPQWILTQKFFYYLDISNTSISDSIPSWFWDLSLRSTFLNLSSNNIGGIPALFSKSKMFFSPCIDLSSNNFEGPIPLFPSSLTSLNLSKNKFSGTLSFLCQTSFVHLSFLDISNNLLTGELPDCLGKLQKLVVLNLAHNTLFGEIPSSVGSLSSLETLYLYNNSFSGVLPKSLSNCKRLSFLDVGVNKFTGNVLSWIGGNIPLLYILSMRSNNFFGTIPTNLCRLTTLQVLDLSINNLSGTIPPCLNNISAMVQKGLNVTDHTYQFGWRSLSDETKHNDPEEGMGVSIINSPYGNLSYTDYSVIKWQGRELEFGNNLKLLKYIDLSSNNLTGEIPDEITELFELVALNLSRNALQGNVPRQIGQLKSLMSLDLSRNRLSDKIPTSLSQLNFLGYLDLSYNNFSGKIPLGTQLQGFDASNYIGNVGLCGSPLPSKCPGEEPPLLVVDNQDNREDDHEYEKWHYIGMAIGFVAGFWGICGSLLLNRRGRYAFFLFLDDLEDWFYVKMAVKLAR